MIEPSTQVARAKVALAGLTRDVLRFFTRPRPLRTQLLVLTLASALPITAFSGVLLWQIETRERAQYDERLRQAAQNLAGDIDRQLNAMMAILETLATSFVLQREEFAEFHKQARQAIAGRDLAIILADPSGQQLLNTRLEYGSPLPHIADLATLPIVLSSKRNQVSNLFFGNIARRPQLNLHTPVLRNGEVHFDLIMSFDPELMRDIVLQQYLPPGWITGISDGNSRIIARSQDHARFVNQPLPPELANQRLNPRVFEANRVDGTAVLRAVKQIQSADWVVAATVEREIITQATRRASAALLLAGLLLISMVATFAAWLSRTLIKEIDALADAAGLLYKGATVTVQDGLVTELNDVRHSVAAAAAHRGAQDRQRELLVRELNHRVKNSFAVLQSILNATLRTTTDPAAFAASFKGRLHSMAAAQDILTDRNWNGAELDQLARGQLAPYLGGPTPRLQITGPPVELPPEAAVPIGLILHELGTNAAKYGALSVPRGRVRLSWTVAPSPQGGGRLLQLDWREHGGPPVTAPERRGFGSTLIERGLPSATIERRFEVDGVVCTIELPLPAE